MKYKPCTQKRLWGVFSGIGAAITIVAIGLMAAPATPSGAANDPSFVVVNAPTPVAFRDSPNWNDLGHVGDFRDHQRVTLSCYEFGGPAGPYGNTLWYMAVDGAAVGWINDHYLNTPGTAAHPQPQTGSCQQTSGYGLGSGNYSSDHFTASSVSWRNFPNTNYGSSLGVANGDTIYLGCYLFGGPAGPYGNTLWYEGYDPSKNTYGWINDHYLSTPGTAANPQPQTSSCGASYYW